MTTNDNERKELKFASGPMSTLALAHKAGLLSATVRYDDERNIEEGDEIDLLSANTEDQIGTASVEHTQMVRADRALDTIAMHWAEYGIQETEYLISRLNDFYDDTITESTEVKVIILNPELDPARPDAGIPGGA